MENQQLTFKITGEYLENIMKDFFSSGQFIGFKNLCESNGFDYELTKICFGLGFTMSGSSEDDSMNIELNEIGVEDYKEALWTGMKSSIHHKYSEFKAELSWADMFKSDQSIERYFERHSEALADIKVLMEYVSRETILELLREEFLEIEGYVVTTLEKEIMRDNHYGVNGVIMRDGRLLACGFQDHINMLPVAKSLGFIEQGDWSSRREESDCFHISSSSYSSGASYYLTSPSSYALFKHFDITKEQIKTIWDNVNEVNRFYLSSGNNGNTVGNSCMVLHSMTQQHGAKYGNLIFLKEIADIEKQFKVKLPMFSKSYDEFIGKPMIVRTSPNTSVAGLLESKVIMEPNKINILEATQGIEFLYDRLEAENPNKFKGNELNYFYQEYIEGINGVAQLDYLHQREKGDYQHNATNFRYEASSVQGDIVQGKKGNTSLSADNQLELEKVMRYLVRRMHVNIQVEFAEDNSGQLYILQIRSFKNKKNNDAPADVKIQYSFVGRTFSSGSNYKTGDETFNTSDVLVVDEDCDSRQLIGKKALIVLNNTDFSHILALAYTWGIPAIFGITDVEGFKYKMGTSDTITLKTDYVDGLIEFDKEIKNLKSL